MLELHMKILHTKRPFSLAKNEKVSFFYTKENRNVSYYFLVRLISLVEV